MSSKVPAVQMGRGWILVRHKTGVVSVWKRRFLVLDFETRVLTLYKSENGTSIVAIPLQTLSVKNAPLPGQPFAWEINSPNKIFVVACNNDVNRSGWLDILTKEIKKAIEGAPTSGPPTLTTAKVAVSQSSPSPVKNNLLSTNSPRTWQFALATTKDSGWLFRKKDGEYKRYWAEMKGDNLYFFPDKPHPSPSDIPGGRRGSVPVLLTLCNVRLGGAMHAVAITEEFSEPHSFTIVTPQTTLYLRAESTDEMLNWITLFNNAATQSRRRPTNPITVSQPAPSEATTNKLDSNTPSIVAPAVQSTANGGEQHTDVSISDQNARILAIASRPENKKCADCRDVDPQWASINIGCFICIECSGIHRSLGTHISKVRSIDLDKWDKATVDFMSSMGNTKTNELWESIPPTTAVPDPTAPRHAKEHFITKKYVEKTYVDPAKRLSTTEVDSIEDTGPSITKDDSEAYLEHEGTLHKSPGALGSWIQIFVSLRSNTLSFFNDKSDPAPIQTIQLDQAFVKSNDATPNAFDVVTSSSICTLKSDDSADYFAWMDILKESQSTWAKRNKHRGASSPPSPNVTPAVSHSNQPRSHQSMSNMKAGAVSTSHSPPVSEKKPAGYVYKQGYLVKRGEKVQNWKRRFFILKDNKLAYYVNPTDKSPKGTINIEKAHAKHAVPEEIARIGCPEEFLFEVVTPSRVYYIGSNSPDERDDWMKVIKESKVAHEQQKQSALRAMSTKK